MSEMTATRMGSPVRLLTLAALAVLWAVAAYFLWATTKVPDGLHLGGVSDRGVFGAHFLHRAQHYERFGYLLFACETIVTLVVFGLYAWKGARFTRESAAGPIGTSMLLAMLGFALVWLVSVPFEVLSLWWQRRYGQSHESYGTVIFGGWLALGVEFVFLLAVRVDRRRARASPEALAGGSRPPWSSSGSRCCSRTSRRTSWRTPIRCATRS